MSNFRELPAPTQASLDEVCRQADRVLFFVDVGHSCEPAERTALGELRGPAATEFLQRLVIRDGHDAGHCMCYGDFDFFIAMGDKALARLSWHHSIAIRWTGQWRSDADLINAEPLLQIMAAAGITDPLQKWKMQQERSAEHRREAELWRSHAPESLRDREMIFDPSPNHEKARELHSALAAAVPDPAEQVEELLRWYGCVVPRSTNYPTYEKLPVKMLQLYDADTLFAGAADPSEYVLRGAARYFLGMEFAVSRFNDAALMPATLRQLLLAYDGPTGGLPPAFALQQLPALMQRCPAALKPDLAVGLARPFTGTFIEDTVARANTPAAEVELAGDLLRWLREICSGPWLGGELWGIVARVLNKLPASSIVAALGDDVDTMEGLCWYARLSKPRDLQLPPALRHRLRDIAGARMPELDANMARGAIGS